MNALVDHGSGKRTWDDQLRPAVEKPTDAVVKIARTTICGTDLHIMKGNVPTVTDGRSCAPSSSKRASRPGPERPRLALDLDLVQRDGAGFTASPVGIGARLTCLARNLFRRCARERNLP